MQLSAFTLLSLAATALAVPTANQKVIHPNGDTSLCLAAASDSDGAAVNIQKCAPGKPPLNQLWSVSGGTFQIFGDKCLDDTNGVRTNGQKMQIWTCFTGNAHQKWAPSTSSSIKLTGTKKCLDNTDGKATPGNPAQIWDCTSGRNQKWTIANAISTTSKGRIIEPGLKAGECLTAVSNADNAAVVIQPCNNTPSQSWDVTSGTSNSGGNIRIFGDKCLDVPNGDKSNGVKMQIYTCFTGNTNQIFTVTTDNRIAWTNMHNCLDLTDGKTSPGTPAQMFHCTANDNNQVWEII